MLLAPIFHSRVKAARKVKITVAMTGSQSLRTSKNEGSYTRWVSAGCSKLRWREGQDDRTFLASFFASSSCVGDTACCCAPGTRLCLRPSVTSAPEATVALSVAIVKS